MDAEERVRKREILEVKKARKHELDVQAALFGVKTDPAINIERRQLEKEIAELEQGLADLSEKQPVRKSQQTLPSSSSDVSRTYSTARAPRFEAHMKPPPPPVRPLSKILDLPDEPPVLKSRDAQVQPTVGKSTLYKPRRSLSGSVFGDPKLVIALGIACVFIFVLASQPLNLRMTNAFRPASPIPATEGAAQPPVTKMVVSGTQNEGLFLRPGPGTNHEPLKTLSENTVVTIIGDNVTDSSGILWLHVRDPEGSEGWVMAIWVKITN
jgi:hypothetical protein